MTARLSSWLAIGAALLGGALPLRAQQADAEPATDCYAIRPANAVHRRPLWKGYVVTVGPDLAGGGGCFVVVSDRAGHLVFRSTGFATAVDSATGLDVDADGVPDVVVKTDVAGGNACCWEYEAISLAERPGLLFRFLASGGVAFRTDPAGRVALWAWEGGVSGLPSYSMADRAFAQRVYRYAGGRLSEVTPEYCGPLLGVDAPEPPAAEDLARLEAVGGAVTDSTASTVATIEALALQRVFCRDFDGALASLRTNWPRDGQRAFVSSFRAAVGRAFPEYAAGMSGWPR